MAATTSSPQGNDAVVTVALFYARIYELISTNSVDRETLADVLGPSSQFWAGADRLGASFATLEAEGRSGASMWLRERAILGARLVARDSRYGAPNQWAQMFGFNESHWQREDRLRELEDSTNFGDGLTASP
jgi:hypothetical protein